MHAFLESVKAIEGRTSYNFCYLSYLVIRLLEMHRILKDTGSIYLHCDPTMSHYIKLLMDIVFGEKNFRNEIVWYYRRWTAMSNDFQRYHDIVFRYCKSSNFIFNPIYIQSANEEKGRKEGYKKNEKGELVRRQSIRGQQWEIKKDTRGVKSGDVFPISFIHPSAKERTGYPTQKPLALLERIIKASSNEGDIVLDPFCGCATTCVASEKLNRQWIGIDVSVKAYDLVRERLQKEVADPENLLQFQNKIHYFTDPPQRSDTAGDDKIVKKYVYIISHPNYKKSNLYKVGIASNLSSRLNSYQTSDPLREYEIEYSLSTANFREIEAYIHKKFSFSHEWVSGKLENIIKAIKDFDINEDNL